MGTRPGGVPRTVAKGRAGSAASWNARPRTATAATVSEAPTQRIGTRAYGTAAARVTVATTSATSAALTLPKGEVMLHASTRCFVKVGTGATNGDIPLEAGEKFHLQMATGGTIAVIRDTADGFLNIIPVA